MRWGKCFGIRCCAKIAGWGAARLRTVCRGKGRWIRRRKCTGSAAENKTRLQNRLRGGVGCAGGSETRPYWPLRGEVACVLTIEDQWLAPATKRKASSIVLTPALDPREPVSIFEYWYRRFGEKLA